MAETNEVVEEKSLAEAVAINVFLTDGLHPTARALTRLLARNGHNVTAMVPDSEGAALVRADGGLPVYADTTRAGEVRSMMMMSKADVVVNLLPQQANQTPYLPPSVDASVVEESTRAVVDAAKRSGTVQYLIHTSFAYLYGDTDGEVADEATALTRIEDPYISAGKAAEKIVKKSGLAHSVVRAGYVYGAESEALRTVDSMLKGTRPIHTGDGKKLAVWIAAKDFAELLLALIVQRPAGEVFNAVDNMPASPKAFLDYLAEAQGMQPQGALAAMLRLITPMRTATFLNMSTMVNNAKAIEALGWMPHYPSYREGLDDVLLSWRAAYSKA